MARRIHFTASDLVRVRISSEPDPMWEVLLSAHLLRGGRADPAFALWRAWALPRVTPEMHRLLALTPARGYSPDFLTPGESEHGLDAGIEALMSTSRRRLRSELSLVEDLNGDRVWLRDLMAGESRTLGELATAVRAYRDRIVEPHWNAISERLEARRSALARRTMEGLEEALSGLHPTVRWEAPTLHLLGEHVSGDHYLDGRGLRIVPSFFCRRIPVMLRDPVLPPVLVLPGGPEDHWIPGPGALGTDRAAFQAVANLLGHTRARVLRALTREASTTELAERLNISPAMASRHASSLRASGLITTERDRNGAHHVISPLGERLLGHIS